MCVCVCVCVCVRTYARMQKEMIFRFCNELQSNFFSLQKCFDTLTKSAAPFSSFTGIDENNWSSCGRVLFFPVHQQYNTIDILWKKKKKNHKLLTFSFGRFETQIHNLSDRSYNSNDKWGRSH